MNIKDYIKKHKIDIHRSDPVFELAQLITKARLHSGLTQVELAKKMKTKQSNISRAESGKVEPSISFLIKVAEAIGTKLILPRFEFEKKK